MEIVTVSTHEEGNFKQLINNKYNEKIKVLGYGQKWYGYKMKIDLFYEYIKQQDDDKIIIFLDGFDTTINKNPELAVKLFKENNYKLLFSSESNMVFTSLFFSNKISDNNFINCGMYMGYVKYLKILFDEINKYNYYDDQVLINNLKHNFDFIHVDNENIIFKNFIGSFKKYHKTDAIFYQTNGKIEKNRIKRAINDYGNYSNNFVLVFNLIVLFLLYKIKKNIIFILYLIFTIIIFIYLYNLPNTRFIEKIKN